MKKSVLFSASLLIGTATMIAGVSERYKSVQQPAVQVNSDQLVKFDKFANQTSSQSMQRVQGQILRSQGNLNVFKTEKGLVRTLKKTNLGLAPVQKNVNVNEVKAASLQESFEGWDGKTEGWFPTGWSAEHKSTAFEAKDHPDWTWQVSTGDGGYYIFPPHENYCAVINTAMDINMETFQITYPEQDEWLITKDITVGSGDYFSFVLQYSPGWMLYNEMQHAQTGTPVFDQKNTNMELMVSVAGGEWTKIWDAYTADASVNYTDETLWNTMGVNEAIYLGVVKDLSAYVGKSVKFAFRYVGKAGNNMGIDFVQVSTSVQADAHYMPPMSYLFCGPTLDADGTYFPYMRIGEAYQDAIWENQSIFGDKFTWNYTNPDDAESSLVSQKRDLVTNYGYSIVDYPVLKSEIGSSSATYQYGGFENGGQTVYASLQLGGNIQRVMAQGQEPTSFPAVNYNLHLINASYWFGDMTIDQAGTAAASWNKSFAQGGSEAKFTGFGTYLPAPTESYALAGVYLSLVPKSIGGDKDAPINVTVYKIENGTLGEVVGQGSCCLNDGVDIGNYVVPCYFYKKIGQVEQEVALTIDSDVMVVVDATYNGAEFALLTQTSSEGEGLAGYVSTYVVGKNADGSFDLLPANNYGMRDEATGKWNLFTSFGMMFEPIYSWMMLKDGESNEFEANVTGESRTFNVDSYYIPDVYEFEGEGLDEWYTVEVGALDEQTFLTPLTVTVDPFTGSGSRVSELVCSVPGSKFSIWIAQHSADGVNDVNAAFVKASVVNGDFVLENVNATSVEIFNVAGQKVVEAAVSGETVVPASDLANGMYIVKFNDNTVVKVVK